MIFIIDKYQSKTSSQYINITGKVFDPSVRQIRATAGVSQKTVLQSQNIVPQKISQSDVAFLDTVDQNEIKRLQSAKTRVILILPLVTADIHRFYSKEFFDPLTGVPSSPLIEKEYKLGKFLTQFWTSEWYTVLLQFLQRILDLKPDGVLIRDLDLFSYFPNRPSAQTDMTTLVRSLTHVSSIPFFAETQLLINDVESVVHGIVYPDFFFDQNGNRKNLEIRLAAQQLLSSLNHKEIFLSDVVEGSSQKNEFIERSKERAFSPVLRNKDEDSFLSFPVDTTIVPLTQKGNVWKISDFALTKGASKIAFYSGNRFLNSAHFNFSPISWPEALDIPAKYTVFTDRVCDYSFSDKPLLPMGKREELFFSSNLRDIGFPFIAQPYTSELLFYVSDFSRTFFSYWFGFPRLQKILDEQCSPLVLRLAGNGLNVNNGNQEIFVGATDCNEEYHNLLLIQLYYAKSKIVLAFGDEVAVKALGFVLDHMDLYKEILNDEPVIMVTAKQSSTDYIPDFQNVEILPLIEKFR